MLIYQDYLRPCLILLAVFDGLFYFPKLYFPKLYLLKSALLFLKTQLLIE